MACRRLEVIGLGLLTYIYRLKLFNSVGWGHLISIIRHFYKRFAANEPSIKRMRVYVCMYVCISYGHFERQLNFRSGLTGHGTSWLP